MRDFIARALKKSAKMNDSQLRNMIELIANEYTLLDALMDSLNYGLIVLDCLHIPLKTNRAIARLLGKPLPSNPRRPLWHYLDDEHIAQFIVAIIKNEVGKARAEFIVQRQGETLYLEVSLFPLICDQKIRGSIIAIHDITEKKQEEIYNRRLESLSNLTNLAATVAHEIKNPLGAMSIHLQLLRKNFSTCSFETNKRIQKHLHVVEEEIERLNRIVTGFLSAVRPLKLNITRLSVFDLVTSIRDTFMKPSPKQNCLSLYICHTIFPTYEAMNTC